MKLKGGKQQKKLSDKSLARLNKKKKRREDTN